MMVWIAGRPMQAHSTGVCVSAGQSERQDDGNQKCTPLRVDDGDREKDYYPLVSSASASKWENEDTQSKESVVKRKVADVGQKSRCRRTGEGHWSNRPTTPEQDRLSEKEG